YSHNLPSFPTRRSSDLEFILLKNTQCKFGPGGQADHLTNVILRADTATTFTPSPVKVEGTLKLAPFQGPDGNTWSIYSIEDAQRSEEHTSELQSPCNLV